jgi:endonuclease G
MAKKSNKKSPKGKSKGIWALLLTIAAVLFYIVEVAQISFTEEDPKPAKTATPVQPSIQKEHKTQKKSETVAQLEIPVLEKKAPSQILSYKGFTVSYNNNTRLPNWVAYELTAEEAEGENPRKDRFRQDPQAYGPQGDKEDYKHSGWDRGHMAPAGDFKWSGEAMDETYYFTNICPQNTQLNTGDWKELEEQCRRWAVKYGSLYIVCGPIVQENRHGTLGENRVVIPDKFYKVVLARINGEYRGAGFIFHNSPLRKSKISGKPPVNRPLESYLVPIDEVEAITGIDFFPALPADTQNRVESSKEMF